MAYVDHLGTVLQKAEAESFEGYDWLSPPRPLRRDKNKTYMSMVLYDAAMNMNGPAIKVLERAGFRQGKPRR